MCKLIGAALPLLLLAQLGHGDPVERYRKPSTASEDAVFDLCTSPVYCQGDLLKTVQLAEIYTDSKHFVDLYQRHDEEVTVQNFQKLMAETNNNPNQDQVKAFVKENFEEKDELVNATLEDWRPDPFILDQIYDEKYRDWASALNEIWKTLARRMDVDVRDNPKRHSLIYVNNTFIIPGGRFKEFYYWDSYWVVKGLLLNEMYDTTRGIIQNFLSIVYTYGFIPNGGRVYYLMRSQPPLLIPMVEDYYDFTNDWGFVNSSLDILEKEFNFWMVHKSLTVRKNNKSYKMLRYITNSKGPRPESYREDFVLAQNITKQKDKTKFYNNIKAGAESGWDFSARWFVAKNGSHSLELADIDTKNIVPVDLNAFVEKNARILARFFDIKGDRQKVKYYLQISQDLQEAIQAVHWDEKDGVWYDYNEKHKTLQRQFYPSNLAPLYTQSFDPSESRVMGKRAVQYLKAHNIEEYEGGIPTSLDNSSQQWDMPNAWPPLQSIVVQGLRAADYKPAKDLAQHLAESWLKSNYMAFNATHKMFEKYDALNPGKSGGGGEYNVQEGFGWSNGVVLEFLDAYPKARFTAKKVPDVETHLRGKTSKHHKNERPRLVLKSIWSHYCQ